MSPCIDAEAFPHILDAVVDYAPRKSLLALRAVSSGLRDRIDAAMVQHVVIRSNAVVDADGVRIPALRDICLQTDAMTHRRALSAPAMRRLLAGVRIVDLDGGLPLLPHMDRFTRALATTSTGPRLVREADAGDALFAFFPTTLVSISPAYHRVGDERRPNAKRWVLPFDARRWAAGFRGGLWPSMGENVLLFPTALREEDADAFQAILERLAQWLTRVPDARLVLVNLPALDRLLLRGRLGGADEMTTWREATFWHFVEVEVRRQLARPNLDGWKTRVSFEALEQYRLRMGEEFEQQVNVATLPHSTYSYYGSDNSDRSFW